VRAAELVRGVPKTTCPVGLWRPIGWGAERHERKMSVEAGTRARALNRAVEPRIESDAHGDAGTAFKFAAVCCAAAGSLDWTRASSGFGFQGAAARGIVGGLVPPR